MATLLKEIKSFGISIGQINIEINPVGTQLTEKPRNKVLMWQIYNTENLEINSGGTQLTENLEIKS